MTDRAAEDRMDRTDPGQGPSTAGPARPAGPARSADPVSYRERLRVPWWWWPVGLGLGVLLAAELHTGRPGLVGWLPLLVVAPLVVLGLAWLGRLPVGVWDGELRVDDAHLPVRYIADVEPLDQAGLRIMLGPRGDPDAFVVVRPWVPGAVVVTVHDPDDPTPYWLVSARSPDRLAAALNRARAEERPAG